MNADPLQQLLDRTSAATAAHPDTDPVIEVQVDLATGLETYDRAQVERALMHEKPERITVLYIIGGGADPAQAEHDPVAQARVTKTQLPGR